MKLYVGNEIPAMGGCVVALGMFDGCHNGHRHVLSRAIRLARRMNVPCVVWTYRRHPLHVIAPERAPKALQSIGQRMDSMRELGVDMVCLRSFTYQEAAIEPEAFVSNLVWRTGVRAIVVGRTNTFGRGARGTPVFLERQGMKHGFAVDIVDTVRIAGERITSSAIRAHLETGNLRIANAMLGYEYALEGDVLHGKQLGRAMGFPTINVALEKGRQLPKYGVYAGWADVAGDSRPCVLNIGIRPTVDGASPSLEAHLLNYRGNLYDHSVNVRFHAFLRGEKKFASTDELRGAIAADVEKARRILSR